MQFSLFFTLTYPHQGELRHVRALLQSPHHKEPDWWVNTEKDCFFLCDFFLNAADLGGSSQIFLNNSNLSFTFLLITNLDQNSSQIYDIVLIKSFSLHVDLCKGLNCSCIIKHKKPWLLIPIPTFID